jgi:PAS domain S-box-containing protein
LGTIIARIRAEEALAASQHNLQTLFDQIGDFVFVLDLQGCIVHANAAVYLHLGYTADELLGQPVLFVHPPDRQAEAARVLEAMLAGQVQACPVPLQTKAGHLIPVETRVTRGQWNKQAALFGVSRLVE